MFRFMVIFYGKFSDEFLEISLRWWYVDSGVFVQEV